MRLIGLSAVLAVTAATTTSFGWEITTVAGSTGRYLDMEMDGLGYANIAHGPGQTSDGPIYLSWDSAPFDLWSTMQIDEGRRPRLAIRTIAGVSKKAMVFAKGSSLIYAEATPSTPSGTFACMGAGWRCRYVDIALQSAYSWDIAINGDGTVDIVYEHNKSIGATYAPVVKRTGTLAGGFNNVSIYDAVWDDVRILSGLGGVFGRDSGDEFRFDYGSDSNSVYCAPDPGNGMSELTYWAGSNDMIAAFGKWFAVKTGYLTWSCTQITSSSAHKPGGVDVASRAVGLIPRNVVSYHLYNGSTKVPGIHFWVSALASYNDFAGLDNVGNTSVVLTGGDNAILAAYHDITGNQLRVAYED
jgi:hypothetical protein